MASWDFPTVAPPRTTVAPPRTADYAPPAVNFDGITNLLSDYVKGKQMGREEDKANLFRNGIPRVGGSTDPKAPIDVGAVTDKLARINPDYAMPLIQTQIAGQQGDAAAQAIMGPNGGGPQPAAPPAAAPSPRVITASTAPQGPGAQPGATTQSGDGSGSIMGVLSDAGIPNDQLGALAGRFAAALKIDPNVPLSPEQRAFVEKRLAPIKSQVGAVVPDQPQPAQLQPAAQPAGTASAAQPQATPGWTQADADALSQQATRLNAYAAAVANVNPKAAEAAKAEAVAREARAKQIRDYISGEDTSTNEQKNASDPNVANFELQKAQQKNDVERFGKQYDTIAKVGEQADETLPQLELAKRLVNDPNFVSGSLAPGSDMLKRLSVAFGLDPNTATPDQVFDKVRAGSILNQIKGMAGTGPVRVAEMKFIDQMIAGRENTPATLRTLLEIESRLYKRAQMVRDEANNYNGGHLDPNFAKRIADYKNSNPLFSKAELQDPRLIAPPVFTTPQQVAAAHLPHGSPFKTPDGRIKFVP